MGDVAPKQPVPQQPVDPNLKPDGDSRDVVAQHLDPHERASGAHHEPDDSASHPTSAAAVSASPNTSAIHNHSRDIVTPTETPAPSPAIAIGPLVEEHYEEIYRYAFRLTGNSADAADMTQQAFLNAQSHLASLRDTTKARGWLYAILRNAFLKSRRKKSPALAGTLELELDHVPDPAITNSPLTADFDSEELQAAIADLPDEFRVVILMFYFEESSYREIAQALEIPEGTVMSRLSRAKGHLRKKLGP